MRFISQVLPERRRSDTTADGASSAQLSLLLDSHGGLSLGGPGAHPLRLSLQISRRQSLLSSGGGGSGVAVGAVLHASRCNPCSSLCPAPCFLHVSTRLSAAGLTADAASSAASLPLPLEQSLALTRLGVLTGANVSAALPSGAASRAASGSPAAPSRTASGATGLLRLGSGAAALRATLAEWGGAAAAVGGAQGAAAAGAQEEEALASELAAEAAGEAEAAWEAERAGQRALAAAAELVGQQQRQQQAPMEASSLGEAALVLELEGEAAEAYAASAHGAAAYAAAAQHRGGAASDAASQASTG